MDGKSKHYEHVTINFYGGKKKKKHRRKLRWTIQKVGTNEFVSFTGEHIMYQMTDDSPGAALSLILLDSKGNPTEAATPPVWTESSNGALLTLTVAPDGMSAEVVPVGPVGQAQVNVTVEGVPNDPTPSTGMLDINIVPGEVATVTIGATPIN